MLRQIEWEDKYWQKSHIDNLIRGKLFSDWNQYQKWQVDWYFLGILFCGCMFSPITCPLFFKGYKTLLVPKEQGGY